MAIIKKIEIEGRTKIRTLRSGRRFSFTQGNASSEVVASGKGTVKSSNDIALSWTGVTNGNAPEKALGVEINGLGLVNETVTFFRKRKKTESFTWQEDPRRGRT